MDKTVLVMGATGGIGGEMVRQLQAAGWQVRALTRGETPSPRGDNIEWLRGDALSRADVLAAAKGCAVIVHAVNPPGYRHWSRLVLPMLDNTISAAIAEGATIVLPGTVYNFGPDAFPASGDLLAEDAPQRPLTRKGAIRVALEARLEWASTQGARVIIVRAGDFFGPRVGNNWFSQGLVKPGQPVRSVLYPGAHGVGHQWSYLPDVARTMLQLLAMRATLPAFSRFHMAGHWDHDGRQMTGAIARVVEQATGTAPAIRRFPWWLVALASPFVATLREMREMRYLWHTPLAMDNARLLAVLGQEPHTPLDEAVRATLEGMGNLHKAAGKKNAPGLPAR
ncbi:NAD(P)H-binding protein [Janthinobacterium sp. SUN128]|uniref:NAD-dependent epimerase/dehydratase family protein n=1 Tax=Janthinobacterium sp. SUN128 TaxID=3014790 RepID=UPI00271239E3|nr:NAD-dependent epimerase/dehydratase family protein [Janthinobacterium sp. SUN128]MDO8034913.1 NAD(P)H-binding protein [Janthinobacterium sp. SUN128]